MDMKLELVAVPRQECVLLPIAAARAARVFTDNEHIKGRFAAAAALFGNRIKRGAASVSPRNQRKVGSQ